MKLLGQSPADIDLHRLISANVQGDYIYMYPPRQAYEEMDGRLTDRILAASLEGTVGKPVNLYLHFPFCKQICRFCNLYAVPTATDSVFDAYVSTLLEEVKIWAERLGDRAVDTVYLGGGTPSLLPVQALSRVLRGIESAFSIDLMAVPEVALEVAPDTVDAEKLKDLCSIGINRINLGLQSASDGEIRSIGRQHGFARAQASVIDALSAGFQNVCIDVIYGLPGQSLDSWRATVGEVARLSAPTVCAYPLTLRPGTGYAQRRVRVDDTDQYRKYDLARDILRAAGYEQETHVRYVVPGVGGYRQKANHWAGQDIVGMGAGARGYLRTIDYRNGYSLRRRKAALTDYMNRDSPIVSPIKGGMELDADERLRRTVVLGLFDLDRRGVAVAHGVDPVDYFAEIFNELESLSLVSLDEDVVALTERGRKYRDLIVQRFFSVDVWKRVCEFDYRE